ncbi:MAG: hypothetical protein PHT33_07855 [bacterium]|nr:hypothetical protein [bacterium]
MVLNLDGKEWPTPPEQEERFQDEGRKKLLLYRSNYIKSAFVDEGHIQARNLGPKHFTRPIPPEESAIGALVRDRRGRIFGGTGGTRAHLFFYDPSPDADTVVDIGVIADNARVTCLAAHPDGRIFGATESLEKEDSGELFVYKPCEYLFKSFKFEYGEGEARKVMDTPPQDMVMNTIDDAYHANGKTEKLSEPVPGEGIGSLVMDKDGRYLYGLSNKHSHLFRYDIETDETKIIGRADDTDEYSQSLVMADNGHIYGAKGEGQLFRYNPQAEELEDLPQRIPSLKGRELYSRVDSWAKDEQSRLIYGGTNDGLLFIMDTEAGTIINLGKPVKEDRIRALTVGLDGRVYGIGGEENGCAHLFNYDPRTRELRDLGVPLAAVEEHWYGYEFTAAATGKWGEIYLGEADRISHLFIYYPPIKGSTLDT